MRCYIHTKELSTFLPRPSARAQRPLSFSSGSVWLEKYPVPFFSLSLFLTATHRKKVFQAITLTMKPSALMLATCPENQGVKAVISVAVMFFLATIVVAIRFYVRLVMLRGATGWDDYFILGSLVSFYFYVLRIIPFGGGKW